MCRAGQRVLIVPYRFTFRIGRSPLTINNRYKKWEIFNFIISETNEEVVEGIKVEI